MKLSNALKISLAKARVTWAYQTSGDPRPDDVKTLEKAGVDLAQVKRDAKRSKQARTAASSKPAARTTRTGPDNRTVGVAKAKLTKGTAEPNDFRVLAHRFGFKPVPETALKAAQRRVAEAWTHDRPAPGRDLAIVLGAALEADLEAARELR